MIVFAKSKRAKNNTGRHLLTKLTMMNATKLTTIVAQLKNKQ
jgi:hypothetical protein